MDCPEIQCLTHLLIRIFLAGYSGYVCLDTVKSSTTFTPEEMKNLSAACLGAAALGAVGMATGALTITFSGLAGTASGAAAAAGTYYGRGGKF